VLAVVGAVPDEREVRPALDALRRRGADLLQVHRENGVLLAVARHAWEAGDGFSGTTMLATDADLVVAADAALVETEALRAALRGAGLPPPDDRSPAGLILAAYRAWGAACVDRLRGDFAFLVWDRRVRAVFCARDRLGTRPLFFAEPRGELVVASVVGAVLGHPGVRPALHLPAVAAAAAGLFAADHETAHAGVHRLPAGHLLRWERGAARPARFWSPPPPAPGGATGFEEGAAELRELLVTACAERMPDRVPTAVWLSGGYDSASVFAVAGEAAGRGPRPPPPRPVSISYPPGDPGREDEWIVQAAAHRGSEVHWIPIDGVPLLDRATERAARRDEPFAHTFEMWNRALARGSREAGARVAFAGAGGDPLFALSPVVLADLLRRGRAADLLREWRRGGLGPRAFGRWALVPNIPPALRRVLGALPGAAPLRGHMERTLPAWIDAAFARRHDLLGREARLTPRRAGATHAEHEMHWFLLHPFAARIAEETFALALDEGVEMRLPLFDERVVRFAAARPPAERRSRGETKRLLRAAMRGLLPDAFLQPRRARTGTTGAYLRRSLRGAHADLLRRTLAAPALADLGIVDTATLRDRCARYLDGALDDGATELHLAFTLQAELWVRSRTG
jgi:asparagine synthase (glutamine-hydrolysing)